MIRKLAITVTTLAVACATQYARADDATAFLAKHKIFTGWQFGDGTIRSVRYDGIMTRTQGGRVVTYADVHGLRAGIASRFTVSVRQAGTTTANGFTGQLFWNTNRNGFTYPSLGDVQAFDLSQDVLFSEGTSELAGSFRGTAAIDGATYDIVRVKPDRGDAIDLYIDPASGAYRRAVIDPGGAHEDYVDILAYKEAAPGKRFISRWKWSQSAFTHEWTSIALNVPYTSGLLHPPLQTAHWNFATQPVPIAFRDTDQERDINLQATVNGVTGKFILDTGAAGIFLTSRFAGKAHVQRIDSGSAEGIGGSVRTEIDRADSVQIGANRLSNLVLASQNTDFGKDIDGVFGFDLFAGAIVELNLDTQQMTLYDPATMHVSDGGGIGVQVDLSDEVPVIPMTVNHSIPINATLDSGDAAGITFSYDLASKYGARMLVDKSIQGITSGIQFTRGVGGVEREECGRLDAVGIGSIVYQNAPACESRSFNGNDALVGFDFIKHFNYIFDYPAAKIILIPRSS